MYVYVPNKIPAHMFNKFIYNFFLQKLDGEK